MRKQIVAGNWKMNLNLEEARVLVGELKVKLNHYHPVMGEDNGGSMPEVILFPPYVYITRILDLFLNHRGVSVGAQNCHHQEQGAFTGEISASMIRSVGATHVIVGHSERRNQFLENDELLAEKVRHALKHALCPVFCCGELLPEREGGKHFDVVTGQLQRGLFWMDRAMFSKVVIAYEPVWAIGTGVTASPEQAQEMHAHIRKLVGETYDLETAAQLSILYGGSCNAKNACELFSQPDVDGGLIGGASLKAGEFYQIVQALHETTN